MKNIKLIIAITATLFVATGLYAQGDVKPYRPLSEFDYKPKEYLQYNFVERKELYLGNPLSELLKDLELPIKYFWDISSAFSMEYVGIDLFFENEAAIDYRVDEKQMPLTFHIDWETSVNMDAARKRSELYGDGWNIINATFYETQVVKDIRVWGNNPSDMPPLPELDKSETTPCCAPEKIKAPSGSFGLPSLGAVVRKAVSDELNRLLGLMDKAENCMKVVPGHTVGTGTYIYFSGSSNDSIENWKNIPIALETVDDDNIRLSDMFDIAKNSSYTFSTMVQEFPVTTYNATISRRTVVEQKAASFRPHEGYYNLYYNFVLSLQTVPVSPYGNYTYKAPTGYDLFNFLFTNYKKVPKNTLINKNPFRTAFFIAYDGSVYALQITDETVSAGSQQPLVEQALTGSMFIKEPDANQSLHWGFIDDGRIQEEFLDAFYRLYDEGSHFSKDDAYIAAFAYILEGRGIAIYRRAPGATEWKRYNTIPITDASGNITGFRSTVWE